MKPLQITAFITFSFLFSTSLTGCSKIGKFTSGLFKKDYKTIQRGMSKKELIQLMGRPLKKQSYRDPKKRKMEVWYFKEKENKPAESGRRRRVSIIRIILREGKIYGWNKRPKTKSDKEFKTD